MKLRFARIVGAAAVMVVLLLAPSVASAHAGHHDGDLIIALGANRDAGSNHFITNGLNDGRSSGDFDTEQYLDNYSDLQAAFGSDLTAATSHFITNGFFEGRTDDILL